MSRARLRYQRERAYGPGRLGAVAVQGGGDGADVHGQLFLGVAGQVQRQAGRTDDFGAGYSSPR